MLDGSFATTSVPSAFRIKSALQKPPSILEIDTMGDIDGPAAAATAHSRGISNFK